MRKWFGLLLLPLTAAVHTACLNDPSCSDNLDCGASGNGGASGQGGSAGNGGQGGGTPAGCVPSENDEAVDDDCGVFVSSSLGDDANLGTKAAPFASISAAIGAANGKDVYVCAEAFNEAVTLPSGTSLYGGLDCSSGWSYSGDKVQLTAASDTIPLTLSPGTSETRIEDFAITAENASIAGGSSIAVLANEATADFMRSDLTAGDGQLGQPGNNPNVVGLDGANASDGVWIDVGGGETCNPDAAGNYTGGMGGVKTCGATDVSGGKGGDGTQGDNGDPGEDGLPLGAMGQGGLGKVDGGAPCVAGGVGANGGDGQGGLGAIGVGALDAGGYIGPLAQGGDEGGHGQGGGGGGGAHECQNSSIFAGPSGGGGGSGGCGGPAGGAGGPGGGSFALISVNATITLTACTVAAGDGADGGQGGDGQLGGAPGGFGLPGAFPSTSACAGNTGGQGGRGGGGGGGLGGHSLAVAYVGSMPEADGDTMLVFGALGMGGSGGTGGIGEDGTAGANGMAAEALSF